MYDFYGVILASGQSSRMQENKLLLAYQGESLITYPMEACLQAKQRGILKDFCVVTCYEEVRTLAKEKGIDVLWNENYEKGQSESMKLGVRTYFDVQEGSGVLFFMGDMPFVTCADIAFLTRHYKGELCVPICGGRRTNPAIFPKKYFDELLGVEGDVGGRELLQKYGYQEVEVGYSSFDVDTREDLRVLRGGFC